MAPTLDPLFSREIGALFLPWSVANAAALEAGEESFTVELEGEPFSQQTQKYHARSAARTLKDDVYCENLPKKSGPMYSFCLYR